MHDPIVAAEVAWAESIAAVNAWRGRCISIFARAEMAIGETLLALSTVEGCGADVALPHLNGQRTQALADAIRDQSLEPEGPRVAAALKAFGVHANLRNLLCHGAGTIARDQSGRWLLVLEMLSFRARQPERGVLVVKEAASEAIRDELRRDCQRLETALRTLQMRLAES